MTGPNSKSRKPISYRHLFAFGGIAFLILIYPLLFIRVMNDPRQRTAADFLPVLCCRANIHHGGMSLVYDWETQRQVEDEILSQTIRDYFSQRGITPPADLGPEIASSEVNPFHHPPYIVPLLGLLAHLDYTPAYVT